MPFGRTTWRGIAGKVIKVLTPIPVMLRRARTPIGARYSHKVGFWGHWKCYVCPSKDKAQVMAGRAIRRGHDAQVPYGPHGPTGTHLCRIKHRNHKHG